jgi:hypothetical protein
MAYIHPENSICRHYNKGMRMIKAKEGPKAIKLLT